MIRKIIDTDDGFITFNGPHGRGERWMLTTVVGDSYDCQSGVTLITPARALELWATPTQMRQIAEAIIASLEAEVTS